MVGLHPDHIKCPLCGTGQLKVRGRAHCWYCHAILRPKSSKIDPRLIHNHVAPEVVENHEMMEGPSPLEYVVAADWQMQCIGRAFGLPRGWLDLTGQAGS